MEHTEIRARVAEVAAPPGGWPNLAGDLTEVKFFLQQGQLDEAYDLLSIFQRRYPGHPELADFARSTEPLPRPDADVERLVDTVMADSSTLGGKIPRRRATPWDAPESGSTQRRTRKLTNAHEVVRAALIEDIDADLDEEGTNPAGTVVVAEYAKNPQPARKPVPKVEHTRAFGAIPPKRMPRVRLRAPKSEMPTPKLLRESAPKSRSTAAKIREDAAKARETAAEARAVAAEVKAVAGKRPALPEPNYAKKGRPATVYMPSVRAEDAPSVPPFEVKPDTSVPPPVRAKPEVAAEAKAKKRTSLPKGSSAPKAKPTPRAQALPTVKPVAAPAPVAAKTAKAKKAKAKKAMAKKEGAKKEGAAPQHTMLVAALQPAAPYPECPNQTMAVDALQPAAPFDGESDEMFEARKEQIKRATSKTGRRRRVATGANKVGKRKRPRGVPPKRDETDATDATDGDAKKRRGIAFGAGVLSRFGR